MSNQTNEVLQEGDNVLLESEGGKKRWVIQLHSNDQFHCHLGHLNHSQLIGKTTYGSKIIIRSGNLLLLRPTLRDFIERYIKATNILYENDAAAIVGLAGLTAGDVVLEIGTGSGGLTTYLANAIRPTGKVHTIDIDETRTHTAQQNLAKCQLSDCVCFYSGNICEQPNLIPLRSVKTIFVDLPTPWELVDYVTSMLSPGGQVFFFLPNAGQIQHTVHDVTAKNFFFTDIFEVQRRDYKVDPSKDVFHPINRQIIYTGIVMRAVKLMGTELDLRVNEDDKQKKATETLTEVTEDQ